MAYRFYMSPEERREPSPPPGVVSKPHLLDQDLEEREGRAAAEKDVHRHIAYERLFNATEFPLPNPAEWRKLVDEVEGKSGTAVAAKLANGFEGTAESKIEEAIAEIEKGYGSKHNSFELPEELESTQKDSNGKSRIKDRILEENRGEVILYEALLRPEMNVTQIIAFMGELHQTLDKLPGVGPKEIQHLANPYDALFIGLQKIKQTHLKGRPPFADEMRAYIGYERAVPVVHFRFSNPKCVSMLTTSRRVVSIGMEPKFAVARDEEQRTEMIYREYEMRKRENGGDGAPRWDGGWEEGA
ncbi:hypothetical protein K402DRAFT_423898 [Aulographum hederae CBS 113979]|uniref:Uncharacterized protein n=1 Tax=Aulographum hederae CBS 113979 TaxID=1176131 RepID=A0A6G1GRE6_9PEZI|nr:hypothetical protein K402DRAFT_423898 [Aulographum hederae CBS 113979]